MPDDEKKTQPEPKRDEQEPGKQDEKPKPPAPEDYDDLIVDTTDQTPPGWGTMF